ncbi:MAG: hypothetical protein AAF682_12120 [Planctomycetota bacterium]
MKRIALRLLALLTAVALAAVAAELAARSLDVYGVNYYRDVQRYLTEAIAMAPQEEVSPAGRIFQNKPHVDLELKTFDYRTDAHGLRVGAETGDAGREGLRALFLGDSVTVAWGVDDEDSWIRRLERGSSASDGRALNCLNAGHLMFDTVQEASLLRAWGPELAPELIVLTFIFNDLHPTYDQIEELTSPTGGAGELGWQESRFLRFFWALKSIVRFRSELDQVTTEDRWQFPPYSYYPDGWPRCAAALDDIKRTAEALGARLVINDHTTPEIPELSAWCEANQVPCIFTALSEEDQKRYRNSVIDTHLNAEGNAVVAELTREQLVELGILAP